MTTDRITANKKLVESFIDQLFTQGNLDAVDLYLHPNLINHDAPFPVPPMGLKA